MSKDYNSLKNRIASDVSAAATSAALSGSGGKTKRLKIRRSDLPSVIPDDASVAVEPVAFGKLSMGDIICVTTSEGTRLRRFIKLKITRSDTVMLAVHEGLDEKEELPKTCLVGRVTRAEVAGRGWDPNRENLFQRLWSKFTQYGTHKPFGFG